MAKNKKNSSALNYSLLLNNYKRPLLISAAIIALLLLVFTLTLGKVDYRENISQTSFSSAAGDGIELAFPDSMNPGVNQQISVPIRITTNGYPVVGVDYVINFNQTVLKLNNITSDSTKKLSLLYPQDTSGQFKLSEVMSTANNTGKISFSEIVQNPISDTFVSAAGGDVIITLVFQTLKQGTSDLAFDFSPGSAQDTNVAIKYVNGQPPCVPTCAEDNVPKDELTSVVNTSVIVGTVASQSPTQQPTRSPTTQPTTRPTAYPTPYPTDDATPDPSEYPTNPPEESYYPQPTRTARASTSPRATYRSSYSPRPSSSTGGYSWNRRRRMSYNYARYTNRRKFKFTGIKETGCSIYVNGVQANGSSSSQSWTVDIDLQIGDNSLFVEQRCGGSTTAQTADSRTVTRLGEGDTQGTASVGYKDLATVWSNRGKTVNDSSTLQEQASDINSDGKVDFTDVREVIGLIGRKYSYKR